MNPSAVIASPQAPPSFTDQALARGVQYPVQGIPQTNGLYGFGLAAADLDGDGFDDLVAIGRLNGQVGVYRNLGTGHFQNRSATSAIAPLPQASAVACADLDGDRLPDLVFTQVNQPSRIYRNLGDFVFAPMALEAHLGAPTAAKGVSLADIDGDGDLDFYIATYALTDAPPPGLRSRLLRNDGATMTDLAPSVGLDRVARTFLGVFSDIDRDGDQDLYVSNDRGHLAPLFAANELWRNDGGVFTDISAGSGADVACFSMGVACGDFDGNGFTDFLVTNTPAPNAPVFGVNPLMLGQGDGTFVRAETQWAVEDLVTGWGALFVDIDNDGHLDLYVNHQFAPNKLWRNPGFPPALLVPAAGGASGPSNHWSYSTVVSDIDGDGDNDLIVSSLGSNLRIFVNNSGQTLPSVRFRLEGKGLNTSAIGSRIDARAGARTMTRELHAGGVGYLGQNSKEMHFGLLAAAHLDEAIVTFPDRSQRTLGVVPPGSHTVVHPAILGDSNGDGALDEVDRAQLLACIAAAQSGALPRSCMWFDYDGDLDVTEADRASFDAARTRRRCDLDSDGTVGARDLVILLDAWGEKGGAADLDDDGVVEAGDLKILLANWG
ncbi:MAG: hypothetical protein GC172_01755 [Phycisphaera sp.]|nr:hypothetical protein [Phycisphaera sp.]